jgi:molecular chaperone DnaK
MLDVALGVDLGNHNTRAAVVLDGQPMAVPDSQGRMTHASVVCLLPDGMLVGNDARPLMASLPKATVHNIKDLVGQPFFSSAIKNARALLPFEIAEGPDNSVHIRVDGEQHTPEALASRLAAHARALAEAFLARAIRQVVFTVPASFGPTQRDGMKRAFMEAGLDVLDVMEEPTAVLLACGLSHKAAVHNVFMCELSATQCTVSVLRVEDGHVKLLAQSTDPHMGGNDFDARILEWLLQQLDVRHNADPRGDPDAMHRLHLAAEEAKNQLADQETVALTLDGFLKDRAGAPVDFHTVLVRKEFDRLCMDMLQRMFKVFDEAIRTAQLSAQQLDHVVLVGGPTRLPVIRTGMARYFKRQPDTAVDPRFVVAFGAALRAQELLQQAHQTQAPILVPPSLDLPQDVAETRALTVALHSALQRAEEDVAIALSTEQFLGEHWGDLRQRAQAGEALATELADVEGAVHTLANELARVRHHRDALQSAHPQANALSELFSQLAALPPSPSQLSAVTALQASLRAERARLASVLGE